MKKPVVFSYHDYRKLIQDWLDWLRSSQPRFSLRHFATKSGLPQSGLSMVLTGKRRMTMQVLQTLSRAFGWSKSEQRYVELLWQMAESENKDERLKAMTSILRFKEYKAINANELEAFKYLTKWYHVAICELASTDDFKEDPKWIQSRFWIKLSTAEIESALKYLTGIGFLVRTPDGRLRSKHSQINCDGGVYRVSLSEFHSQMFKIAIDSIANVPSEDRYILGHTFAIKKKKWEQIRAILDEAVEKIKETEKVDSGEREVVHLSLAAIPLTHRSADHE